MIKKVVFAIFVFFVAVVFVQPVGINFIIVVEEIPQDQEAEGFIVQAQAWNFGNGQFKIIIDPDEVNDPQINRIVAHEIGHVVNWEGDEAFADDFANQVVNDGSEPIVDAFHGVH